MLDMLKRCQSNISNDLSTKTTTKSSPMVLLFYLLTLPNQQNKNPTVLRFQRKPFKISRESFTYANFESKVSNFYTEAPILKILAIKVTRKKEAPILTSLDSRV